MTTESSNNGSLPGLLEGVRVIDLTHYISGPYCTKLMATLGAEVIKIERPGSGDPIRRFGPFAEALTPAPIPQDEGSTVAGAWFLYLNTSKKSLTLDLHSDAGKDILRSLVSSAQIVVENFAPGTMDKLGLGYSDLEKLNPSLVMTSISNYGQTGPYRDWKATELNLYAAGGLMYITGEPDSEPLKEGAPLAQLGAGQTAFVATMGALMHAEDTGHGQHIDLSIADYATNILENAMMQYSYSGEEYTRVGNRGYGRAAWGIYPCQDGYVGIISGPDTRWPEIAGIMEREELSDPRFASRNGRLMNADEVDALMLPWLLDHDKVDIFKAGQEAGLGFGFVATMEDILEMEQLTARNYFVELDHGAAGTFKYPGAPIRTTSSTSPQSPPCEGGEENASPLTKGGAHGGRPPSSAQDHWVYRRAPHLGEHTEEILGVALGHPAAEIARLRDQGVI